MAHFRKPLAAALALNTAIFVVEALCGWRAHSLSLITDSVHNLSDELALVFLYLAFVLPTGLSPHLVRSANFFNSVGLVGISAVLLWQATATALNPVPVVGLVPAVVGVAAALANWGVARLLRGPSNLNPSIRLAYLHNLGDVQVSLAPVLSGVLVSLTGHSIFDPLIAGAIALWLIVSTLREVVGAREELLTPRRIECGHGEGERSGQLSGEDQ